ncbi:MAG TPA: hypothetical protein VGQ53_21640 [Chitinophagaceae bacterium]|nr:hypothetical protein [Chitinophagaceae bacterium]
MKKSILITALICIACFVGQSQSIDSRNWKAHLPAPINDTVTLHLNSDSSFIANSDGQVVIRMSCMIVGNTLTLVNQDPGEHGCPDQKGTYAINYKGKDFTLSLISDPCEGRSHALAGVIWTESSKNEQPKSRSY